MSKTKTVIDKDGNERIAWVVTPNAAYKAFKILTEYCNFKDRYNVACQNCIFHIDESDHWECQLDREHIEWDLELVEENYRRKKANHGFI